MPGIEPTGRKWSSLRAGEMPLQYSLMSTSVRFAAGLFDISTAQIGPGGGARLAAEHVHERCRRAARPRRLQPDV